MRKRTSIIWRRLQLCYRVDNGFMDVRGRQEHIVPVTAYLNNRTDEGAKGFLDHQGPELYRGGCREAGRR